MPIPWKDRIAEERLRNIAPVVTPKNYGVIERCQFCGATNVPKKIKAQKTCGKEACQNALSALRKAK